ncbi:MAG: tetratricopeptide repeat protein [Candidatus Aminicenantes bacterium]|nr:MAG: tetratricopeptide repeat protein [Candidatus Aminicenantes bacterium]
MLEAEPPISPGVKTEDREADSKVESIINQVKEYREAENFEEALKLLKIALEKFPQNEYREKLQIERADLHYFWADYLKEKYDYANAIKHFELAYAIDKNYRPKDAANSLSNIGRVYSNLGQNQKALAYYEKALPIFQAVRDRAKEAGTLNNLMFCWNSLKNTQISIFYGKQSVNAYQNLWANISKMDRMIKKSYLEIQEDTYRFLAGLLIDEGRLSEAQHVLDMLKEKEYFDFTSKDQSTTPTYSQLDFTGFENQWLDKYRKVTKDYSAISGDYYLLKKKKIKNETEKKRLKELEASLEQYQKVYNQYLAEMKKAFDSWR